ncbi:MAG: glycoside hydrolase family 3 C-terminal domain-containing protein [Lachnospiraceae bacterium]|nr:glycoside hydrolase family 3 C-terminal domain-containing protein [Lachnospiraceae bacterium]
MADQEKWSRYRYMPGTGLYEDRHRVTGSKKHTELAREAARESMVLLKNEDRVLPFREGQPLAVFGKGQVDYVQGGGGSGVVWSQYSTTLLEGLEAKEAESKILLFSRLSEFYRKAVERAYEAQMKESGAERPVPGKIDEPELPDDLLKEARGFTDMAVLVYSRYSSEGADRTGTPQDGDFYLSPAEQAMTEKVLNAFPKAVVVLNVGGVVDTSWIRDDLAVKGCLYMGQAGMEGGMAAADLLTGDACPSGHLTDTFADSFASYPFADSFRESPDYLDYTEDIYVGYRYFETLPGAAEKVVYPFGYGLSYTSFRINKVALSGENGAFTAEFTVQNVGLTAGRALIQLYVSCPAGRLGKPKVVLAGFARTKMLLPAREENLRIRFSSYSFASFDDTGLVKLSSYLLEQGTYQFFYGENVRDLTKLDFEYTLEKPLVIGTLPERLLPHRLSRRLRSDGSFETLETDLSVDPAPFEAERTQGGTPSENEWAEARLPRRKAPEEPPLQLTDVSKGEITLDHFLASLSLRQKIALLCGQPNRGVANTFGIGNLLMNGVPNIQTADGPQGLRLLPRTGVSTTAFPSESLLSCSWDMSLLYEVGKAIGEEVKENGIGLWLAPAVNLHRSPLCGRNFEYLSEDPLLSGMLSAALVQGAQSVGIGCALKHFACNNKEENRKDSDSRVSIRALRELYLKAFEICVKVARPLAVMTSYNLINEKRASENRELLSGVLRDEWGFDGLVITDWWNHGIHEKEIAAGNDVKMPAGSPEQVLSAVRNGSLTEDAVTKSARRVLEFILKLQ